VTLPLDGALPTETTLTAVALGDVAWVALPGEPATALGLRIKTEARRSFRHAFVAGVSNDYVAYLVTAADHGRPSYVTCGSVYEAGTGDDLTERAIGLLRELYAAGRGGRERGEVQRAAATRRARADFLRAAVVRGTTPFGTALSS